MAVLRLLLTLVLALNTPQFVFGQDLDEALQRLLQHFGRRPVALTWHNQSTMPQDEADAARKRFESVFEISPAGIETIATLSENRHGYLLVVQTADGKVFAESWQRPPSRPSKPSFRLKQVPLGESAKPLLDGAVSPDGRTTMLLEPFRILSPDGRSATLALPRPLPRDPRGRIQVSDSGDIKVQLPGMQCSGTIRRMQCNSGDELGIVPGRNYFKGLLGLYYSLVETEGAVFESELDGHTRLYTSPTEPSRVLENWGSELAPAEAGCGAKIQVLTSLDTDQAQAFEFSGGRLKPSTEPLSTNGPVVAMWPASERKDQVTMVVRNRVKGTYEASRLSISCTE